jgi:hypothetical protein
MPTGATWVNRKPAPNKGVLQKLSKKGALRLVTAKGLKKEDIRDKSNAVEILPHTSFYDV